MAAVLSRLLIISILAMLLLSQVQTQEGKPPPGPHTKPCKTAHVKLTSRAYPLAWTFPEVNNKGQAVINYALAQTPKMMPAFTPDSNMIFHARFVSTVGSTNIDLWNEALNYSAKKKVYIYKLTFPRIVGPIDGSFQFYLSNYESCDIDIPGLRVRRNGQMPRAKISLYAVN